MMCSWILTTLLVAGFALGRVYGFSLPQNGLAPLRVTGCSAGLSIHPAYNRMVLRMLDNQSKGPFAVVAL